MKNKILQNVLLFLLLGITFGEEIFGQNIKTITFLSEDSLAITADTYITHKLTVPIIILFHQAGWSRGEYLEIAPKLNKLGFNCIAIDQRSGDKINNVVNKTHKRAVIKNKPTTYLDAYKDMTATINFVKNNLAEGKIIVWGSSYSAGLVFRLTAEYPDIINGLLAFSPGEYYTRFGKSKTYISEFAQNVKCPVFITSAHNEKQNWINIYNSISTNNKYSFLPVTNGNHGSRALWNKFEDSSEYWSSVKDFLRIFSLNYN